ncbi:MAG: hypothetical protein WD075_06235 [Rhodospirillales bacterium]
MNYFRRVAPRGTPASIILLASLATACAPMNTPPQQISSSEPTVTYKYQNDTDLYQADQRAMAFCSEYSLMPRPMHFSNDPDGNKVVMYDCVPIPAPVTVLAADPSLSYTYSSDQELLNASRNAQVYCMNNAMRQVSSSTVINANGTKTISFQCGPI